MMRRVLIAPDSFKGTLTAAQAAAAIGRGVAAAAGRGCALDRCPVADGGEGTMEALEAALRTGHGDRDAKRICERVRGPLGSQMIDAEWLLLGEKQGGATAVIELAQAAGLVLVDPAQRDPTRTTTRGVGELIMHGLRRRPREIIIAIGGSATCDGGCGAMQALGARFFDHSGAAIETAMTGGDLLRIGRIELPAASVDDAGQQPRIRIACDVTNPLAGERGAAPVFAPQKGATPAQVAELEDGLAHLAALLPAIDPDQPGMGAAGGIALGLSAVFPQATLERGVELILDAVDFDGRLRGCDLVITGEGRLDAQSLEGKVIDGVSRRALRAQVPVIVIAGAIDAGRVSAAALRKRGIVAAFSLVEHYGEDAAMQQTEQCLERLAARALSDPEG